uniref:Uncharacterized protein n=1 Tax=Panagrolaimus davidi TaxID=227884 RepID=A0A914Q3Q8_9BILA
MYRLIKYENNFDSILWPKIKKETKPILENIVFSFIYPDQYISFFGQTFNTTKKVWIKYNFGTFKDLKFVIDFANSKIDAELINSTAKDVGSLKLKQQLIPGQIINFTISTIISKNESLPSFYVNGEFLNFTFYGRLNSFRYGGDWLKINTTKRDSYFSLNEIASSFEYAKPNSKSSTIFCDENFIKSFKPKFSLNYTALEVLTDFSPSFIIDMFGPNETIEYELRESLCPNTFTTKIQIEIFQNSSGSFYITPQYDAKKIESCSFFLIKVEKTSWSGSCQNSSYLENTLNYNYSPTFGGAHNGNIKYFVQGPKRKLIC